MSYYTGDYYRGDPGFFGFARSLLAKAAGGIPIVGGVAEKLIGRSPSAAGAGMSIIKSTGGRILSVAKAHPIITAAGAAGLGGIGLGALGGRMGAAGLPMKGFHISKKTGKVVKNRRMRVTNPRALRRAIRRATGFAHLARRVLHFTSPRAPKGRAIFKHRRRKK